jgi:hypothetical protein
MIAVIVLAAGLLALTALQGSLIRASADSKARSQIAAYAESEMDRIRLGGVGGIADSAATTIAGGFAGVSSLTRTVAVDQYIADASGAFVLSADTANPGNSAHFKRVTLTMGWTDATGGARSLSMSTDVSPLALNASNVLVDRTPPDDAGLRPIVRRVSPLTEGMIPLATGGDNGEQTAATNPKPKLLGGENGSYVSDTRYDVLTYSSDAYTPTGFSRLNKKIETATVGCTCRNDTSGFSGNNDYLTFSSLQGYRPTYWDGTTYVKPTVAATAVSSSPATGSQSELCDVCCRDHKDPNGETGPKFSPWPGQNPNHYRDSAGTLVVAGTGETYLEACRVIRVDGTWRVAADPKVQDLALVATQAAPPASTSGSQLASVSNNNSATSPRLSTPGTDAYEQYAYDQVNAMFFSSTAVAAQGNGMIAQSTQLNEPVYVPVLPNNDRRWMHARLFVTDYLETDAREKLRKASADCSTASTATARAQCVLPYVPMSTTNVTEIAVWMPRAPTGTDTIPGGLASLNSTYLNYAKAYINRYNSGVALVGAINPDDNTSPALDEQLFVQLAASAPTQATWLVTPSPSPSTARYFGNPLNPMRGYAETSAPIPFNLSWNFPNGNPSSPVTDSNKGNDPTAVVAGGATCSPGGANNNSNPYTCQTGSVSDVVISMAGYNRIEYDNNFNNPCGSGKVIKPTCVIYTFNGASVSTPSGSVPAGSYSLVGGASGKLNEMIQITIPAVSPSSNSSVTVDFTRRTQDATYTCDASGAPVWTVPCQ